MLIHRLKITFGNARELAAGQEKDTLPIIDLAHSLPPVIDPASAEIAVNTRT